VNLRTAAIMKGRLSLLVHQASRASGGSCTGRSRPHWKWAGSHTLSLIRRLREGPRGDVKDGNLAAVRVAPDRRASSPPSTWMLDHLELPAKHLPDVPLQRSQVGAIRQESARGLGKLGWRWRRSQGAVARPCRSAGCTSTPSSKLSVSTSRWRLGPESFLAPS
jgi:hypothetical protein